MKKYGGILCMVLLCIFINISNINFTTAIILPTVVLNPWNPVFSCDPLTIKVRIGDNINFGCAPDAFNYYIANANEKTDLHESLYYLGNDTNAFNTCNATGGKELIKCGASSPNQPFDLIIREDSFFTNKILMPRGGTYYFIDTAYRTLDNIDNLVNGSCNTKTSSQYHIRFKLYVCTQEEEDNGNCEQCTSEACYYKDCTRKCSGWSTISDSFQERQCTNDLFGTNETEYRPIQSDPTATVPPNPSADPPTGSPRSGDDDNSDTETIAIAASIGCFIIGIALGVIGNRYYNNKSNSGHISDHISDASTVKKPPFSNDDGLYYCAEHNALNCVKCAQNVNTLTAVTTQANNNGSTVELGYDNNSYENGIDSPKY